MEGLRGYAQDNAVFYRFSLYFTAVITGILLVMSMVCMYGYKSIFPVATMR